MAVVNNQPAKIHIWLRNIWQLSPVLTYCPSRPPQPSLCCGYNLNVRQLSLIIHHVGIKIAKEWKVHKNVLTWQEPGALLAAGGRWMEVEAQCQKSQCICNCLLSLPGEALPETGCGRLWGGVGGVMISFSCDYTELRVAICKLAVKSGQTH